MNTKLILASLILGSSSLAMAAPAAPGVTVTTESYGAADIRDHRGDTTPYFRGPAAEPLIQPVYYRDRDPGDPYIDQRDQRDQRDQHNHHIDQRDQRDQGGGWDQGGRWDQSGGWRGRWMPPQYRAVTLASGLPLAANSQTTVNVGAQLGRFGKLDIKPTSGRVMVRQVYVQFANDQVQILRNVDRMLTGHDCLTVDLDGDRRAIKRVIVYGAFGNQGWRRTSGTFSLTAS
jgi:hypothetical protein